jgi:hypothetical protein
LLGSFSGLTSKKARVSAAVGFVRHFARRSTLDATRHRDPTAIMAQFRNFFQTTNDAMQVDQVSPMYQSLDAA